MITHYDRHALDDLPLWEGWLANPIHSFVKLHVMRKCLWSSDTVIFLIYTVWNPENTNPIFFLCGKICLKPEEFLDVWPRLPAQVRLGILSLQGLMHYHWAIDTLTTWQPPWEAYSLVTCVQKRLWKLLLLPWTAARALQHPSLYCPSLES